MGATLTPIEVAHGKGALTDQAMNRHTYHPVPVVQHHSRALYSGRFACTTCPFTRASSQALISTYLDIRKTLHLAYFQLLNN
jgi:hypothetical protein